MIINRNGFGNDDYTVLYITADEQGIVNSPFTDTSKKSQTVHMSGVTSRTTPAHDDFGSRVLVWDSNIPSSGAYNTGITTISSDYNYGVQDYCLDFHIYLTAWQTGYVYVLTQYVDTSNYMIMSMYAASNGDVYWYWKIVDNDVTILDFARKVIENGQLNTWYHIACLRMTISNGEEYKIYGDGIFVDSSFRGSTHNFNISSTVNIGKPNASNSVNLKNVCIDNFRMSVGNKRWGTNNRFNIPNRSY